jgi:hypothetical protein
MEECGPCPIFAGFTLVFALQLRKKHGETSVRVAEECQLAQIMDNSDDILAGCSIMYDEFLPTFRRNTWTLT